MVVGGMAECGVGECGFPTSHTFTLFELLLIIASMSSAFDVVVVFVVVIAFPGISIKAVLIRQTLCLALSLTHSPGVANSICLTLTLNIVPLVACP